MQRFDRGDRVQIIDQTDPQAGKVGTVTEVDIARNGSVMYTLSVPDADVPGGTIRRNFHDTPGVLRPIVEA